MCFNVLLCEEETSHWCRTNEKKKLQPVDIRYQPQWKETHILSWQE